MAQILGKVLNSMFLDHVDYDLGQLRRLNDLGFAVDEIEVVPADGDSAVQLRVTTTNRVRLESRRRCCSWSG